MSADGTMVKDYVAGALQACGWVEDLKSKGSLLLETPAGTATLKRSTAGGDWQTFDLVSPSLNVPEAADLFLAQEQLPGPAKFVRDESGAVRCRIDLPRETIPADSDPGDGADGWAAAVRAIASGTVLGATEAVDLSAVQRQLDNEGWPVAKDGNRLRVSIALPRVFRQVHIEPDRGLRLAAELINLSNTDAATKQSVRAFLQVANRRLRLVRIAERNLSLFVEVHLSVTQIPGPWLSVALEVIRQSLALCAKEVDVLRDPVASQLVPAFSVGGKGGVG